MPFPKLSLCVVTLTVAAGAADTGIWKVAPAPPASWQSGRVADLAARRKAVLDQIGDHGILILYAAEARNYAKDVDWPYRQENDFFYLTGLTQPDATLVLIPAAGKMREIVFLPRAVPSRETWTGHMITPAEAREISGIQDVFDASQLNGMLSALVPRARAILTNAEGGGGGRGGRGGRGGDAAPAVDVPVWTIELAKPIEYAGQQELQLYMVLPARPNAVEYRREQEFAGKLASVGAGLTMKDATPVFDKLRRVKSPREIEILQHAVDITAEAFQRAYAYSVPGTPEYEIQAQFEFTFLRRNAHWGYPCIVGSGVNATTLHYGQQDTMKDGDPSRWTMRGVRSIQRGRHPHDRSTASSPKRRPISTAWCTMPSRPRSEGCWATRCRYLRGYRGVHEGLFALGLITDPASVRRRKSGRSMA